MSTFVTVGTSRQPFTRLLSEVALLSERGQLPEPVCVQHGHTPFASSRCECKAFITREEHETKLAEATLVLSHGGVTILQARRFGKVPVVMPRRSRYGEHIDDHQLEFAKSLEGHGEIVMALEPGDLWASIQKALAMQVAQSCMTVEHKDLTLVRLVQQVLSGWDRRQSPEGKTQQ